MLRRYSVPGSFLVTALDPVDLTKAEPAFSVLPKDRHIEMRFGSLTLSFSLALRTDNRSSMATCLNGWIDNNFFQIVPVRFGMSQNLRVNEKCMKP